MITSERPEKQPSENPGTRIVSLDVLRGAVIVLMMLDHVRDFTNRDALLYNPQDLSQTNGLVFWTRFTSHFCAPIFVLLAGISVRIQLLRGKPKAELSRWLVVRGLFLIALEVIVLRPLIWCSFDLGFIAHLQVIWVIGWSMILLAGLIWLPISVLAVISVAFICLHNLLDRFNITIETAGNWYYLWVLLHQSTIINLNWFGGTVVLAHYPLIPWPGVMALGFVVGGLYRLGGGERRTALLGLGLGVSLLFVLLRLANVYGDNGSWYVPTIAESPGLRQWERVLYSFLNTEKYPPSLQFLCMTLGPGLLSLGLLDRAPLNWLSRRLLVFGSVPLFFYILQWPTVHLISLWFQLMAGQPVGWDRVHPFGDDFQLPDGCGFSMPVTYVAWIFGLLLLYPLCVLFGRFKYRHRDWKWLSLF